VEVTTFGGETLRADTAVIAVPLPALRALGLDLPEPVRDAMAHTCFGDAAKLHLPLAEGAEPRGVAPDRELWWHWVWSGPSRGSEPELEPLCPLWETELAADRIGRVLALTKESDA